MKLKKSLYVTGAAAMMMAGMGLTSCSDYLDLKPIDNFGSSNFWQNQSQFEGNIVAIMNQFRGYEQTHFNTAGEKRAGAYSSANTSAGLSSTTGTAFINSNITESSPGFENFAHYYGLISNCNTFIHFANANKDLLTEEAYNGMLAIVYGIRANAYFQIHRMYGNGPLRLEADVILGNYDPTTLYKPRCKASEMIAQIRADLDESLRCFEASGSYTLPAAKGNACYYWNKPATEMLYGEFLMWIGKVSTDDYEANGAEVSNAKQYFESVVNNYGYQLVNKYEDVFSVNNKKNSETIFSFSYALDVATVGIWSRQYQYPNNYGVPGRYIEDDGNWLGYVWDAENQNASVNSMLAQNNFEPCYTEYKNALVYQFDKEDGRDYVWIRAYNANEGEKDEDAPLKKVDNFDPSTHYLAGAFFWKYRGQLNASGMNSSTNDMIFYRLPLAYTYLAEIANWEGNNGDVEKYINLIRQRAYGENFAGHEYVAGDFLQNEVAILQEKDKEFICEGQRWWDIRRMKASKDGDESQHLIFRPEGCVGWGLNVTATMCEVNTSLEEAKKTPVVTNAPVLDYETQKHLVLYPLDEKLLGSDPELTQTPGYVGDAKE